jgi:hypothetical protein
MVLQALEQAVQKKKRILLLRREMERARAAGAGGQGGFLRRLVNSVVRPGQSKTPAETILSLQAEVQPFLLMTAPDRTAPSLRRATLQPQVSTGTLQVLELKQDATTCCKPQLSCAACPKGVHAILLAF